MTISAPYAPSHGTDHLSQFLDVRALTDRLTASLSAEDQTPQSMTEASPTKWHRAHVTWFFEEFVLRRDPSYVPYDDTYRYLFNSYYEAVGDRHPRQTRGLVTRPGVNDVAAYRHHVDTAMETLMSRGDLDRDVLDLVELGCNHEQQHQELLLMDLKHLFSISPFTPGPVYVDRDTDSGAACPPLTWRPVKGGGTRVGASTGFAYDNEGPAHRVLLEDFEIASRAVTNGDWMNFIADGGYDRPELWLSDGWAHIADTGWRAPGYWRRDDDGGWTTFTLSGRRPVVEDEPVMHVSFYEADAYARWADARLPTEFEWEAAANDKDEARGELLDPARCHPRSAGTAMLGDVWEWTASAYLPYPGFTPANGAVGEYNGKFMCDQHVLRGASAITPRGHERTTYRNFFPASSRWAFSGLRLAR